MATTRFSRRNFLTTSSLACAGLAAGASMLTGCSSVPVVKATIQDKKIDVATSAFVENKTVIVKSSKLEWDILLIKNPDGYKAIEMKCTHRDNPLVASSTGTLHCTDHGSRFDNTGKVTEGPATNNLKTFKTANTDTTITIFLV